MPVSESSIVIFDGVCNLCNASVQWLIKRDKRNIFRFVSAQQVVELNILPEGTLNTEEPESVMLLINNQLYSHSDAAIMIATKLGFPYSMLAVTKIFPAKLRDVVYNYIARNRYKWFGKKSECMIPTPELRSRFITSPFNVKSER